MWAVRGSLAPPIPSFVDSHNIPLKIDMAISASGDAVAMELPDYLHKQDDDASGEVRVFHWSCTAWTRTFVPRVRHACLVNR